MSMRLQAKLMDQLSSQMEESFMREQDLMTMETKQVEATVEMSNAFIEYESPAHSYLPCLHMMGRITELRGDFPYDVSSLYFSEADNVKMMKDFYYYPSPDELSHMITTGRFYSPHFAIPPILSENTYSLPCSIDMMVVPPTDLAAYQEMCHQDFEEMDDDDKMNLPVFYIGIEGTGVSKKNDRLLAYYGLDFEEGYDQFVLTAESSGYTNPPLMMYMEAPVIEEQVQEEETSEYHLTPEEENEIITSTKQQKQQVAGEALEQTGMAHKDEYFTASPEDALIAQTDRKVEKRMEQATGGKRMSLEAIREQQKNSKTLQDPNAKQEENQNEDQDSGEKKLSPVDDKQNNKADEKKSAENTGKGSIFVDDENEQPTEEDKAKAMTGTSEAKDETKQKKEEKKQSTVKQQTQTVKKTEVENKLKNVSTNLNAVKDIVKESDVSLSDTAKKEISNAVTEAKSEQTGKQINRFEANVDTGENKPKEEQTNKFAANIDTGEAKPTEAKKESKTTQKPVKNVFSANIDTENQNEQKSAEEAKPAESVKPEEEKSEQKTSEQQGTSSENRGNRFSANVDTGESGQNTNKASTANTSADGNRQDPQQMKENQMDFDSERNAFVDAKREEDKNKSHGGKENEPTDTVDLERLEGADVSDQKLQTKVDEKHAEEQVKKRTRDEHQIYSGQHQVPSDMQEMADEYDAEHEGTQPQDDSPDYDR